MFAAIVFTLCALTSLACAVLLLRGYLRSRSRLLFWSSLCFVGLALQNAILLGGSMVFPGVDLSIWRNASALVGLCLLLFGLIWEVE